MQAAGGNNVKISIGVLCNGEGFKIDVHTLLVGIVNLASPYGTVVGATGGKHGGVGTALFVFVVLLKCYTLVVLAVNGDDEVSIL